MARVGTTLNRPRFRLRSQTSTQDARTAPPLQLVLAASLLIGYGCDDPTVPDTRCGRDRLLTECTTWTRDDSPFMLTASVTMDTLIIESGVTVYAGSGVALEVGNLFVNGTASDPVWFLPQSENQPWGGIRIGIPSSDSSHIRHAIIEGASGPGVFATGRVRIEEATIRHSGSGIALGLRTVLHIGGTLEGNVGSGIESGFSDMTGASVVFERPVRIVGNGGYPLAVPLASLAGVMSDETAQQDLLGNH